MTASEVAPENERETATETAKVLVVTDPMCSWCWGMAPAIQQARQTLAGAVSWDAALGGINLDSAKPVGRYGTARLMDLWHEVSETTGQHFAGRLPEGLVYNSGSACRAVEALRRLAPELALNYVHALQRAFFVDGEDPGQHGVQLAVASSLGVDPGALQPLLGSELVRAALARQVATSRTYGTQALPNLVFSAGGGAQGTLLLGGYADAPTIVTAVRKALELAATANDQ